MLVNVEPKPAKRSKTVVTNALIAVASIGALVMELIQDGTISGPHWLAACVAAAVSLANIVLRFRTDRPVKLK